MRILFQLIFIFFLMTISCNKKNNLVNPPPTENPRPTGVLQMEKNIYNPLEVASATIKETLHDSSYKGSVNNTDVIFRNSQGSLLFFVPDFPAGSYTLKVLIGNVEYSSQLVVSNFIMPDINTYFNSVIAKNDSSIFSLQNTSDTISSFSVADRARFANDLKTIKGWLTNYHSEFNSLSLHDKQVCVKVIAANDQWLNELDTSLDDFVNAASQLRIASVSDQDKKDNEAMAKFTIAQMKLMSSLGKVTVLAAAFGVLGSSFLPPLGTVIGVALGAKIGATKFKIKFDKVVALMEKLLDRAIKPFQGLVSERIAAVEFTNNVSQQLSVSMEYRSLYTADKSSSLSFEVNFFNSLAKIKEAWIQFTSYLPSPMQYHPKVIEDKTTFKKVKKEIHSDYLTITNVTNNVTLNYTKADGYLKATAVTSQTTPVNFSYTVNYNSINFGVFSSTISATVAPFDSLAIYKAAAVGNWIIRAPNYGLETDRFTFYPDGTGIFYWKMTLTGESSYIDSTSAAYKLTWRVFKSSEGYMLTIENRSSPQTGPIYLTPHIHYGGPYNPSITWRQGVKE